MLLKIYPENPAPRHIEMVLEGLKQGHVFVFPTDTVYGLGCDLYNTKAFDRLEQIKGGKKTKKTFSIIVSDISMLSEFTKPIDNSIFRMLKRNIPGPFTFILEANSSVPKLFQSKKRTIGVRIPDNPFMLHVVQALGHPLVTTSIHNEDKIIDYTTDPELIHEQYEHIVDGVVDGGFSHNIPSTVIDCTGGHPEIIREGLGLLKE
ncbi:MAG: threonylcarbamoyl-AMP synthase [Bacteroidales bacterium]|nr:threonylcarbamoyl-AMP synthase [Bacteroidales bacterium]